MEKTLTCPQCGRKYAEPSDRCSIDGSALYGPDAVARLGQHLGNYELLKIQGVGGMGVVYKGRHVMLGKPVAVKVLHDRFARREGAMDQFLREAQAATRIRHPNIVDVTDFGISPDGSVYFVMEYLEGISLEDVLARDGCIALFNAVNVVRQIARALAAAHEQGIVHRDLKPENVFLINQEGRRRVVRSVHNGDGQRFVVEKEGRFDFVKLLDFGVAKFTLEDVGPSISTRAGMIFGTPHYMSPEQARGEQVDGRSDIYALGIMFYEMVTSSVPFDGESALDILNGHVFGTVLSPQDRSTQIMIDDTTNQTIMRCLEKDPNARFQTMDELVDVLGDCFTDQVFLRDAHKLPGAVEAGIIPPSTKYDPEERRKGITSELAELFSPSSKELEPLAPDLAVLKQPTAAMEQDVDVSAEEFEHPGPAQSTQTTPEVHLLTPLHAKPSGRKRQRTPTNLGLGSKPQQPEEQQPAERKKRRTSSLTSRDVKKS